MSQRISATLCLSSGSYQAQLAEELHSQRMLVRVFRFTPRLEVLEPRGHSLETIKTFPEFAFANRLLWGVWRRIPGTRGSRFPIVPSVWLADRLLSGWISPCNIFHGMSGNALHSTRIAKEFGAITLVENAAVHPRDWAAEVLKECHTFAVDPRDCYTVLPKSLIKRTEHEYQGCDRIVVPSSVARRSFENYGYGNIEVIWPGIDTGFFQPSSSESNIFRVCYAGRVELAKGVVYLLEAWKKLQLPNSELVLMGEIRPELRSVIRPYLTMPNVRFTGFISPEKLRDEYRASSVFVFPSLHEGFGLVVLEAMASGLPVIATKAAGAVDCISDGKEGFWVGSRDPDGLAEAILWGFQHRGELKAMGTVAVATVQANFTLQHYHSRVIALYERLIDHR